jgi:hypothetical protein
LPFAFVTDVLIRASIQIPASEWQTSATPLDAELGERRRAIKLVNQLHHDLEQVTAFGPPRGPAIIITYLPLNPIVPAPLGRNDGPVDTDRQMHFDQVIAAAPIDARA